jgi:NADH dehydrogenase [ubiquinone] 1 alpha subcomplex assembly factor 5
MSRVQRAKGGASQLIFNRPLKIAQKARSAQYKESPAYKALFDFPLMHLVKRMQVVKK